nr:reverse transcriptase, RNA-dependent DNA polymerase [Tanacetum cinerariifolium]
MVTAASVGVAVKTLMIALFCLMIATFAYLFVFGDYLTCFDTHARWFLQITTDFTIYVAVLGAWYAYKESSWIMALGLMVPMYFLGSIISIGYILTQFYKLSPEESSKDPLYFVLARRQKRGAVEHTRRHSVVIARVIYLSLGSMALGTLIYSVYVDLSPSYIKYFTSCFLTIGTDIYIHVVILSVWVAYKESSNWITAFFWILSFFCFRGLAICVYIVRQLYNLSPQQPASLIIFNNNRYLDENDPPLMVHPNV